MALMPLVNSLKQFLSDLTAFYLKAQGYSWNVEGENFTEYHELFKKIYLTSYSEVDPTGEYIRIYDSYAPSDMEIFTALSQIKSKPLPSTDATGMALDLYEGNKILLMDLKDIYNNGSTVNEQGLLNFVATLIRAHQQWDWQLRSSLKNVVETEIQKPNENIGLNAQGINMSNDLFSADGSPKTI
jgi:starvation-inducible DNA-binding protein